MSTLSMLGMPKIGFWRGSARTNLAHLSKVLNLNCYTFKDYRSIKVLKLKKRKSENIGMLLQNVRSNSPSDTASHRRRLESLFTPL
jgi:hypothetical protein